MNKNLIKNIIIGVITVVLISLQASNALSIFGVFPDFLLILVILHSNFFGEFKGEIFGFSIGLVLDSFYGSLFGLNAFVMTFIGWFTSIYKKYILVSDIVSFVLYLVIATIIKYIFFAVFHWIFNTSNFFDVFFFLRLLGEAVYNIVLGIPLFLLAPLLYKREEEQF